MTVHIQLRIPEKISFSEKSERKAVIVFPEIKLEIGCKSKRLLVFTNNREISFQNVK